jgi:hypothetical protein
MFQAVTANSAGGEIICLDKSSYGGATINQSTTISCGDGLWEAPGTSILINTPASAEVVIEGLVNDGQTSGCCNIQFIGSGTLRLWCYSER